MAMTDVIPIQDKVARMNVASLDVTVLAGGPGAEREVSLQSGSAVGAALRRLGHCVEVSDISPDDLSSLDRRADIAFIALHGLFGEDGALQVELERRGIPYTGTGSAASRLAMDKVAAKRVFEKCGVPTPAYEVVDAQNLKELTLRWTLPVVVKPVDSGSSVDTWIARSPEMLQDAARKLVDKYGCALVEQLIDGPELTVGILGDRALPVCEIRTKREFYDFDAKYVDDDTEYLFDLDLPPSLLTRVQVIGLEAHRALDCRVFSRVDVMLDAVTHEPYVLEINTIPGFTGHSLVPKAAARIGMGFDQLCQRIIELSLAEDR